LVPLRADAERLARNRLTAWAFCENAAVSNITQQSVPWYILYVELMFVLWWIKYGCCALCLYCLRTGWM
jgi:hypothetical protein